MSLDDQNKWDKKYGIKQELLLPREESAIVRNYAPDIKGAHALDLACGAGRNSIYLAKRAYSVDAVDIAKLALDALKEASALHHVGHRVACILKDLDHFSADKERYDLVIMCHYLDRTLIKRVLPSIKLGGRFIIETYMHDEENEKKESKRSNLLEAGELYTFFDETFKVLFYDEFENEAYEMFRMKKQAIVVERVK